jgi:hypothetical protein
MILLQGDHRDRVKQFLIDYGFPSSSIEVHWDNILRKADVELNYAEGTNLNI